MRILYSFLYVERIFWRPKCCSVNFLSILIRSMSSQNPNQVIDLDSENEETPTFKPSESQVKPEPKPQATSTSSQKFDLSRFPKLSSLLNRDPPAAPKKEGPIDIEQIIEAQKITPLPIEETEKEANRLTPFNPNVKIAKKTPQSHYSKDILSTDKPSEQKVAEREIKVVMTDEQGLDVQTPTPTEVAPPKDLTQPQQEPIKPPEIVQTSIYEIKEQTDTTVIQQT